MNKTAKQQLIYGTLAAIGVVALVYRWKAFGDVVKGDKITA